MGWWMAAVAVGSALLSNQSARSGARNARRAGRENASALIELNNRNNLLLLDAANRNAESILRVGEANARAIEETARNNAFLGLLALRIDDFGFQEDVRQHIQTEKYLGGQIRAMASASGISVNEGSPLHFYNAQIAESQYQLRFKKQVHFLEQGAGLLSIATEMDSAYKQAGIARLEAEESAYMTRVNATIDAEVSRNEALTRAESMRRGADIGYSNQVRAANMQLLNDGISAYGAYRGGSTGGGTTSTGGGSAFATSAPLLTNTEGSF